MIIFNYHSTGQQISESMNYFLCKSKKKVKEQQQDNIADLKNNTFSDMIEEFNNIEEFDNNTAISEDDSEELDDSSDTLHCDINELSKDAKTLLLKILQNSIKTVNKIKY